MKVALVIDKFHPGRNRGFGGFVGLSELARYLQDAGEKVTVFGYPPVPMLDEDIHLVALAEDQPFHAWARLFATTRDLLRKRQQLKRYDIIHSTSGTSIPALTWIRDEGTRFLFDMQNDLHNARRDYNLYKRVLFSLFNPDFVMFIDPPSLRTYQRVYRRDNCEYFPPSVDTTHFIPQPRSDQQGQRNVVRVLFAGVLRESKGLLDLLRAVEGVWETQPQAQLVVAGYGPLQSLVERKARESESVQYLGFVPHHEMATVYNGVDLYVLPSSFEGFPRSILEAMACGVPVITTPISGMATLDRSVGVHLIEAGNIGQLTHVLKTLIEDETQRQQDGQAAREYVEREHSPEKFFHRIMRLYRDLLGMPI